MYTTVLMVIGAAIVLYGLPLFARLIPKNPFYGFRAAAIAKNDEVWYRVNRVFGGGLSLCGVLLFGIGAVLDHLGSPTHRGLGLVIVLVMVVPLFIVYIWTMVVAHRTSEHRFGSLSSREGESRGTGDAPQREETEGGKTGGPGDAAEDPGNDTEDPKDRGRRHGRRKDS